MWHNGKIKRSQPRYQVWFIFGWISEGATFICSNNCIQVWTPWERPVIKLQEGDRWTCFGVKRPYQPQNKSKTPCEDAAEAGKRVLLSRVKPVLNQHGLKGHSAIKKLLLQNNSKIPDHSLQMCTRTNPLISGDMSCSLMTLNLNCLAIMTIIAFDCNPENTIPTMKYEGGSIMLWGCFLLQKGLVHFTK